MVNEMIINLDLQSETPIYIQLKNKIIEGIASKELLPGEDLPSVRTMAADLGVNMHTVNKAYQLLKKDGFILIHRQKGVVIHPDGLPTVNDEFIEGLKEQIRPLISESICRGMDEKKFVEICQKIFKEIQT